MLTSGMIPRVDTMIRRPKVSPPRRKSRLKGSI
jgi:hypothetical protein